jgi:hypothetical protein
MAQILADFLTAKAQRTQRGKAATNFGFWILDFGLKTQQMNPTL